MILLFLQENAGGMSDSTKAVLAGGAIGAVATFLLGLISFAIYRRKNAGEGVQAEEKGKQEQIHTSELQSALDTVIEENTIKSKTIHINTIEKLLQTAGAQAAQIGELIDRCTDLQKRLGESLTLNESQAAKIARQNEVILTQWERYELMMKKFGVEENDHAGCLELVGKLGEEVSKLRERVRELEMANV